MRRRGAWLRWLCAWSVIYAFWLYVSRDQHPTTLIAALSTLALVVAFAAGVAWDRRLSAHRAGRPLWVLALGLLALTLAAVGAIQAVYGVLWHPDPLRYSLGLNVLADGIGVLAHVAAARGLAWLSSK